MSDSTPSPGKRAAAEDHYYAALDLFSSGNHAEAIREYNAALEIDPSFTDAMHGLCRAHQDLNQLDEAIAVANEYICGTMTLEDLAGNSLGRPFEVDVLHPIGHKLEADRIRIPFKVP